ncbi:MAG: hypothetical protein WBA41_25865 [Rivularia sp. (in: cyanobacteria)]
MSLGIYSKAGVDNIKNAARYDVRRNMNAETEKLLGILEFYNHGRMFVWDKSIKGNFNIWKLLISEGFVKASEPDKAIKHWFQTEFWGTITNQKYNDIQYAPLRRERENDDWNNYIRQDKKNYYQALSYFLKKSLQNLQAYIISGFSNWDACGIRERFKHYIILGQTQSKDWVCLTPTMVDQVWDYNNSDNYFCVSSITACRSENADTRDIVEKINKIIRKIKPREIYGHYFGDYYYSYYHQLFCTSSSKKYQSIELALRASSMLDMNGQFTLYECFSDDSDSYKDGQRIGRFMNRYLTNRKCFTFSFWDVGCGYDIGCTSTGDWIGFRYENIFLYNP